MGGFYNNCFLRFWMYSVIFKQLKPQWLIKASALVPFWWQVLALFCERAGYYRSKPADLKPFLAKTVSRCQKSHQLLLPISQVSLISRRLISHLSVEQRTCENKIFVAKEHLVCIFAIYFLTLNDSSFLRMKYVMWPAAVVDKVQYHTKERERIVMTNSCFVLVCSGCRSVVAWTQVTWLNAWFLHSPSVCRSPAWCQSWSVGSHTRRQPVLCHLQAKSVTFFISADGNRYG